MILQSSIETIKGVGKQTAEKLRLLGIETAEDLLYFFPRKYEDFSNIVAVSQIEPGPVTIQARVDSVTAKYVRRGLHITEAVLCDKAGDKVRAVWYNQSYRITQLQTKDEFYFSGVYDFQRNRYVLSNPSAEKVADVALNTGRIVPVYKEVTGVKSHNIRKLVHELRPLMQFLPETLPAEIVKSQKLMSINEALVHMHFPENAEKLAQAKERFAFTELFELLLASLLNKQDNTRLPGWQIPFKQDLAQQFTTALPFTLTGAQKRAAWEILQDFNSGSHPMNRLLQGDVGSGKTAVAAMAGFMAVKQGFQVAFMAPTEILATQHAETLAKLLEPLGINFALLLGSVKPKAKKALQERIAAGDVDIVVGTHALIQKETIFHKLGFVVIDEQHRFGVQQRADLLAKSERMPHLLSMSATPIPRSLALTVYGELEVSVIDELPKGRKPIETEIHSPNSRAQLYAKIDQQIAAGRQVYVVCPLIGESETSDYKSVEEEFKRLKNSVFKHRRLGMLHGQLKSDEKEAIMHAFKQGSIDILISTTVVEVGVDVPNASIMLIEGADRFGLAQLHQLRGRVGRGEHQSYCYLVPSSSQKPSQRLRELEKSQDGFYLAEVDLELRGPGEIYGKMQHGKLNLQVANLADTRLTKRARQAAEELLKSGVDLVQYKRLHTNIMSYRKLTTLN